MNKKSKIIVAVIAIVIISTLIGVLCWGLQPVKKDSVSLKKLNKKLGDKYCIPSELPFEGDVECFIIYNEYHWNLRFEINANDVHGYSIELKDSNRQIDIGKNELVLSIADQDGVVIEHFNNQKIEYLLIETETDNSLIIQFVIDGKSYQINAKYNKDVNSEILKSDIKFLLEQMIK